MSKKQLKLAPAPTETPLYAQLAAERETLLARKESAFQQEAETGQPMPYEVLEAITGPLGLSDRDIQAERGRHKSVAKLRKRAGSAAHRKAARDAESATQAAHDSKISALREKLAAIEQEIDGIVDARDDAARVVFEIDESCRLLREKCPAHIEDEVNHRRRLLAAGALNKERLRLKTRLRVITGCLNMTFGDQQDNRSIELHCQQLPRDHVAYPKGEMRGEPGGPKMRSAAITVSQWNEYRAQLTDERPKIEAALAKAEEQYQKEMAEVTKPLNYYIDGDGAK